MSLNESIVEVLLLPGFLDDVTRLEATLPTRHGGDDR